MMYHKWAMLFIEKKKLKKNTIILTTFHKIALNTQNDILGYFDNDP